MKWLRGSFITIVVLLVAFVAVIFVFKNSTPVTVDFFVVQISGYSIALWLVLAFLLGGLLGLLAGLPAYLHYRAEIRRRDRNITKKDLELQKLRGDLLKS
jgi:uncharacterized integral membrane protein